MTMVNEKHSEVHPSIAHCRDGIKILPPEDQMPLKQTEIIYMFAWSTREVMPGLGIRCRNWDVTDNE